MKNFWRIYLYNIYLYYLLNAIWPYKTVFAQIKFYLENTNARFCGISLLKFQINFKQFFDLKQHIYLRILKFWDFFMSSRANSFLWLASKSWHQFKNHPSIIFSSHITKILKGFYKQIFWSHSSKSIRYVIITKHVLKKLNHSSCSWLY